MLDDPMKRPPWKDQAHSSLLVSLRLNQFLMGAIVLGFILTYAFQNFLSGHPGLAVLFAVAYIVLCATGAYFKMAPRPLTTHDPK